MLQTIREHTQGWIAGVIISVIILTFALWGIHSYFIGGTANTDVASVNGVEISRQQLALAYERVKRQIQLHYGAVTTLTPKDETTLKKRALEALIEIEALKQASLEQGFKIFKPQVNNFLLNMPDFQVNGQFSEERFHEVLSSSLLSTGEFLDLIQTSLLIDQAKLGIVFTSFALPDETNYNIALIDQERNIEYIKLPFQYFSSQPIAISSSKIENYYKAHQNDFMTPEQVVIDYIELALNDLVTKISVPTNILESFYNENKNSFTQPMTWKLADLVIPLSSNAPQSEITKAKEKADAIVKSVKNGGDFNAFVRQYPTKILTQPGMLSLNQIPAELQKTVALLTNKNQVSGPIHTKEGFVILKVLDVKEATIQTFDAAKDKVKEAYARQHAEEQFAELRDQLADLTYEHPDTLEFASKKLNLPIKTSASFTKNKPGNDISQYTKVRDIAFSNEVLNLRNNSDVIQLNPETVIVLRVKSHVDANLLPITAVSKQIEDKLKKEEAETHAEKFAQDFKAKLQGGADPQQLANSYKFTWNKVGYIGRYPNKIDSAILETAFSLPHPDAKRKVIYEISRVPDGYVIVALSAVKEGNIADKKQYAIFAEQEQNSEGLLEYELYKKSQISNASIKIY